MSISLPSNISDNIFYFSRNSLIDSSTTPQGSRPTSSILKLPSISKKNIPKSEFPLYTPCDFESGLAFFDLNKLNPSNTDRIFVNPKQTSDDLKFDFELSDEKIKDYNQISLHQSKYNNTEIMNIRRQLRNHSGVLSVIDEFWNTCSKDSNDNLPFNEYCKLHEKIIHIFYPKISTENAVFLALDDWRKDTGGFGAAYMTKEQFVDGMFNLTDFWSDNLDARKYILFLTKLYYRITAFKDNIDNWKKRKEINFNEVLFNENWRLPINIKPPSTTINSNEWIDRTELHTPRTKKSWRENSKNFLKKYNNEKTIRKKQFISTPKTDIIEKKQNTEKKEISTPKISKSKTLSKSYKPPSPSNILSGSVPSSRGYTSSICSPMNVESDLLMASHFLKTRKR